MLSVSLIESRHSKALLRSDKMISNFLKVLSVILSGYKSDTAWQMCSRSFRTSSYVLYPGTVGPNIFLISACRISSVLICSMM